jgi:hypothetical protein
MDQMPAKRPRKSLNFEKIIGAGQNPNGFTAQTANGTAKAGPQSGWNRQIKWPSDPQVPADGAWNEANRSGE